MNKVILIGNLTRAPELRTTSSGISVCNFTLAVGRAFKNAQGERETDFFTVIAWRQLGTQCMNYLEKGKKCAVVGQIQNRSYEAKDGTKRTVSEILADDVEFLSPSGKLQEGAEGSSSQPAASFAGEPAEEIGDDELPF